MEGTAHVTCFHCHRHFEMIGSLNKAGNTFTPKEGKIVCPGCGSSQESMDVSTGIFDGTFTASHRDRVE